ncbi:MAG TPA: hypothetical protein DEP36_15930 [Gammaproteobacteria bacterium]|nr:hypothetical protein [Gammaproteobacteria bacterium]
MQHKAYHTFLALVIAAILGVPGVDAQAFGGLMAMRGITNGAKVARSGRAASGTMAVGRALRAPRSLRATTSSRKFTDAARRSAVRKAWAQEHKLVTMTSRGTRKWTPAEKQQLLKTGKVKGYEGHHINSVKTHPHLAGKPNNVMFLTGPAKKYPTLAKPGMHQRAHARAKQRYGHSSTRGPLIDREALLGRYRMLNEGKRPPRWVSIRP